MVNCIVKLLVLLFLPISASAYTVIIPSTAAPAGTEQELICQTTTFFNATVTANPLFPDTYLINLYGPAVSQFTIIKDSGTYAFIFTEGLLTERATDINNIVGPDNNCDASPYCLGVSSMTAPGNYKTYASTYSVNVSAAVCQAIMCRIAADIYQQDYEPNLVPDP